MSGKKLEITFPVLNEEHRLENGIKTTIAFFEKIGFSDYALTIADNGSSDKTEEIGNRLQGEYSSMVNYVKVPRRGVGLALRTSWTSATSEIVGYMDIDLATDLDHLSEVIELFRDPGVSVVCGSRLKPGARVENRTAIREITSRVFNSLLRVLLGVKFTDGMCGFKFLRTPLAKNLIASGIDLDGWFFCTEILVKSEWLGISVTEIPVHWTDGMDSKVRLAKVSFDYLNEIRRLMKEKKAWKAQHAS